MYKDGIQVSQSKCNVPCHALPCPSRRRRISFPSPGTHLSFPFVSVLSYRLITTTQHLDSRRGSFGNSVSDREREREKRIHDFDITMNIDWSYVEEWINTHKRTHDETSRRREWIEIERRNLQYPRWQQLHCWPSPSPSTSTSTPPLQRQGYLIWMYEPSWSFYSTSLSLLLLLLLFLLLLLLWTS